MGATHEANQVEDIAQKHQIGSEVLNPQFLLLNSLYNNHFPPAQNRKQNLNVLGPLIYQAGISHPRFMEIIAVHHCILMQT